MIYANPSIFLSKSRFSVLVNERMIGFVSDFISLGEGINKSDYYNKSVLFLQLSEYQRVFE